MRPPKLMPDPDRPDRQISVAEYKDRVRDKASERRRRQRDARKERTRLAREARKEGRLNKKAARKTAKRDELRQKIRETIEALQDNRPLMFAVGAELLFIPITVLGNLMFLQSLEGWSWFAFLQYPLALAPEYMTWTFAANATSLARDRLPYSTQTRLMWLCAFAAASLNAYHGVATLHNVSMAYMLGVPSIAGPGIWHVYLHLRKRKLARRSADEIISDMWTRICHPILMFRRRRLWAEAKGSMSLEQAWLVEFYRAKGYLPGQKPVYMPDIAVRRLGWLRRLLDRALFGVSNIESKALAGKHAAELRSAQSKASTVGGARNDATREQGEEQGTALALPVGQEQGRSTLDIVTDQIAAYMNGDTIDLALVPAALQQGQGARALNPGFPSSGPLAQQGGGQEQGQGAEQGDGASKGKGDSKDEPGQSKVSGIFGRRRGARARATAADLVREFYAEQRSKEVPPEKIFGAAAATFVQSKSKGKLSISRQGASEVIVALRSKECETTEERREA